MNFKDRFAAFQVRTIDNDLAIKSARSQQCRVQHFRRVGCSDNDDSLGRVESIHLSQQLIERLFSLIISEHSSATAGARFPDRIQFIDKDDAGSLLLGLLKQIPHAGSADADEHLDEFRSGNRKEWNAGFAADGFGEQSLAGAGRTHKKDSLWNSPTELLVFCRLLEEIHHLHQFGFGLVNSGNILETDVDRARLVMDLRPAFAESQPARFLREFATTITGNDCEEQNRYHPWK